MAADAEMGEASGLPVADPRKDLPHPSEASTGSGRLLTLGAIVIPLAGLMSVPFLVWGWGFHWTDLVLFLVMYVFTTLGITVGFHRYFVHHSFETSVAMQIIFALLGSMAVQGPLFRWVAIHRVHHQFSDQKGDPHSPKRTDHRVRGGLHGFWHAHVGWFFDPDPPHLDRIIKDLTRIRALRVMNMLWVVWVVLGLLIPAGIGFGITHAWSGLLTGLVWGGIVRILFVHHITWSINSACHLWGRQPYRSGDLSRNNTVFGYLGLGEGWHNSHHAFPASARHGLRWWQLDVSYLVIKMLAFFGLVWHVKTPSRAAQHQKEMLPQRSWSGPHPGIS